MAAYRVKPDDLKEHFRHERIVIGGGYGDRLVYELIQNGVDAMLEQGDGIAPGDSAHRMQVIIKDGVLYAANTGAPLSREGAKALLSFGTSPKWGQANAIGRFGLGFKSILTLGGVVDVVTRDEGIMRFDPDRSRKELAGDFGDRAELPAMRLAWHADRSALDGDPLISTLEWAETVIRAEVKVPSAIEALQSRLQNFPAEFLIFVDRSVTLEFDLGNGIVRSMRASRDGEVVNLEHAGGRQLWRRFSAVARVKDEAARRDGTEYHARESVPVIWAVPIGAHATQVVGNLWAFAPTQTRSHVGGILNAPWKVNSDRTAVIGGAWTGALFTEAADLIVASIHKLAAVDDPGAVLDGFPRKSDSASDIATPLVEAVWERVVIAPQGLLPDMDGVLRQVLNVRAHPVSAPDLIDSWGALASDVTRSRWVHHTCMRAARQRRLDELRQRLHQPRVTLIDWLHAVAKPDADVSSAVIRLADRIDPSALHPEARSELDQIGRNARVILGSDGMLHTATEVHLCPEIESAAGLVAVHPRLSADDQLSEILRRRFGVRSLVREDWNRLLEQSLSQVMGRAPQNGGNRWSDADCRGLWQRIRECPSDLACEWACASLNRLPILRMDRTWGTIHDVLLPAQLPEGVSLKDVAVLLDSKFHGPDGRIVSAMTEYWMGDRMHEVDIRDARCPEGLRDWAEYARAQWAKERRAAAQRPFLAAAGVGVPCGLSLVGQTKGEQNAHLTHDCLRRWTEARSVSEAYIVHTSTQSKGRAAVVHPLPWSILRYGSSMIGSMVVPIAAILHRRATSHLDAWDEWPIVKVWMERLLKAVEPMDVGVSAQQLTAFWDAISSLKVNRDGVAHTSTVDLWMDAAQDGYVPSDLRLCGSSWRQAGALVTTSAARLELASRQNLPCVLLPPSVKPLWLDRGAKDLDDVVEFDVSDAVHSSGQLGDMFPELAVEDEESGRPIVLSSIAHASRIYYVVDFVRLLVHGQAVECVCEVVDGAVYVSATKWGLLSRRDRLRQLLFACAQAGWLARSAEDALEEIEPVLCNSRRAFVREAPDLEGRLIRCVGGRAEVLRESLGELGRSKAIRQLSDRELAALVLSQLGPSTLSAPSVKEAMRSEGLKPPHRWGSCDASAFCDAIGFGLEFAGSASERRPAEELVSGPIPLPVLHDYQVEVCDAIEALLKQPGPRRRAVIRLPTGGGKTRVAVEALVRHVLSVDAGQPYVLWIAQTDELCEQAVQSFIQVWSNVGVPRVRLRVGRLWASQPAPTQPTDGSPLVVVASIQTLSSRRDVDELQWLGEPSAFVIDECHHADAPTYRDVTKWIETSAARRGNPNGIEPLILGLSATPFRMDVESSSRLAQRFDRRIMPRDQADLDRRLIDRGMLAKVLTGRIETEAAIHPEEERRLARASARRDGLEIERILQSIDDRLAGDDARNSLIVSTVKAAHEGSVLLFANSVGHSRLLAAQLHLRGVPAVAISGDTAPSARRYFLDRFQQGSIRVICNHSVLSTGFDAPKVNLIVISRQVLSPVRYLQMVGRGLRGQRNGGTEVCRVLTVLDNLQSFRDMHAYHYFERYYRDLAGPPVGA